MALAMQGFFPGAQAGIMFKRTNGLFGGPVAPVAPEPVETPIVAPPPPAADESILPGPGDEDAEALPITDKPIYATETPIIEDPLETSVEIVKTPSEVVEPPVETPVETPTFIETPEAVEPPVETPTETPEIVEPPVEVVETPTETPVETSTELVIVEPPIQTPIETPAEIVEPPVETPTETPEIVEPPVEVVETPTETPIETSTELVIVEPPVQTPVETPAEIIEPPVETPIETPVEVVEPPVETPIETPEASEAPAEVIEPPIETPVETPEVVEPPAETPIETPIETSTEVVIVEPPVETPSETPAEVIEPPVDTPTETPEIIQPPTEVIETPTETPTETAPADDEDEAGNDNGQEVTVTITQDNGVVETVTQTLPAATVTAIITQPIIIIVRQETNFNFDSSLGGVCPPVKADPAGSGGFVVGDDAMLPTLPQACRAACESQFKQCSAKAGQNFKVEDCQKQLDSCNQAAAGETIIEAPAQTVTKTVFLPPTDVPGVDQELENDGCEIITTQTLPPDEVATIGDDGISVITTTVAAEPTGVEPEVVETTMVVTLDSPPAGGNGPAKPSVVTMTMTVPAASQPSAGGAPPAPAEPSVVTVTVGGATGVVTLPAGPQASEDSGNSPTAPDAEGDRSNLPAPPSGTDASAPAPPPAVTQEPGQGPPNDRPGRPGRPDRPGRPGQGGPGGAGEGECPEPVTVTVSQDPVTVTVTKDAGNGIETPVEPPAVDETTLISVVEPTPEVTPPSFETPLVTPGGSTLTTKIGATPTGEPIDIPDALDNDDAVADENEKPTAGKRFFARLFGGN
ncbi:hypothetical protein LIA77_08238 [Sarocladium implicatum]|nr:hypothetical protein LIA77_08238 [Sarocladium implicatum]